MMHKDCYFYHELQDMGATIKDCSYDLNQSKYYCPCKDEKYECDHYISRNEVDGMIKQDTKYLTPEKAYQLTLKVFEKAVKAEAEKLIPARCNQCKYYEGVHNVQGHAPCSYWKSGSVMWDWFCSQGEKVDHKSSWKREISASGEII